MYAADDPRAGLAPANKAATPEVYKGAQYAMYYKDAPQEDTSLGRLWYTRGQNAIIVYADVKAGYRFERKNQPDEYAVLTPSRSTRIRVTTGSEEKTVEGYSLVMVPAGASTVEALADGLIVFVATTKAPDLVAKCGNASAFGSPDPNVAPFQPWPAAVREDVIHAYDLEVAPQEGRFGRIFRSSNLMINVFEPSGPRDTTKLSPHHHDDFEQYSLVLAGEYVHHLRWPWNTDLSTWRPDETTVCEGASLAVIPPPAIHTTRSTGARDNLIVDIFSPPRFDFSAKPGWVLNEKDYPAPAGV
jgi:mannose-6-phosphate isomerase-like protein (cupin superfamily)